MTGPITRRKAMTLTGAGVALVPTAGLARTSSRERLEAAVDELRAAIHEHYYRCEVYEWVELEGKPPQDGYAGINPLFCFVAYNRKGR